jgi:hypothetical protein
MIGGCVNVTEDVFTHPLKSVIVEVYVPGPKLEMFAVVAPFDHCIV